MTGQELAILSVCRQLYREAEPLVLPNVHVRCGSNAAMVKTLLRIGPERITQLRHLIVLHVPMGVELRPKTGGSRAEAAADDDHGGEEKEDLVEAFDGIAEEEEVLDENLEYIGEEGDGLGEDLEIIGEEGDGLDEDLDGDGNGNGDGGEEDGSDHDAEEQSDEDDEDPDYVWGPWTNGIPKYVRHFHVGALLGLFPGLQLDLLEVFGGTGGGPWTPLQTTDCLGSLLEADGYRRLWMEATDGDGDWWSSGRTASVARWKRSIEKRIRPYGGSVTFRLREWEWEERDTESFWVMAKKFGITLTQAQEEDDDAPCKSSWEACRSGHESEEAAGIVVDRGDAEYVVKEDERLLRCIDREDEGETKAFYKRASDGLRKLFRENSWEAIRDMPGFDDGDLGEFSGSGNRVYCDRW